MPFYSLRYLASLNFLQHKELTDRHTLFGWHPETKDDLYVSNIDRYAGTYALGVQGIGKSGLLQNLSRADMKSGHAVIVIDPHGDLTRACLSCVPEQRLHQTFLLDLEDEAYPFGVNLFPTAPPKTALERTQIVERIMHIFRVLWPEVVNQQYVPLYLPNAVQVFIDNPGKTMVDMLRFFQDDSFRASLLLRVKDESIKRFWHTEYGSLSKSERDQKIKALTNRLHTLFTGHSLVRNIMGQSETTVNFRKAMEDKHIIFIKLPVSIPHVARLVGTILLAQISDAVFSFGNVPEAQRPGVSLYMDEFQEFATADIEKLFTQGRKFGMRLTIAHQHRGQLPSFLLRATTTARTKVCFQLTPEDGREMAPFFPSDEIRIEPDDVEDNPVNYLLHHPSNDEAIRFFTDYYLMPMKELQRKGGKINVDGYRYDYYHGRELPSRQVVDPTVRLNNLLYEAMRERNAALPIPPEVVEGFSVCGVGFYNQARRLRYDDPRLFPGYRFPQLMRRPESGNEQMLHCISHLRVVMQRLAENPIGKATITTPTDVAKMLTQLPRRAAFVRSGDTVGVIYTHDTPPPLARRELFERVRGILEHTQQVYCHPKAEVERQFMQPSAQPAGTVQPVSRWEVVE